MLSEADREVMEAAAMLLAAFFHTMASPSQRVRRLTCAADARLAPDIVGALHARMFLGLSGAAPWRAKRLLRDRDRDEVDRDRGDGRSPNGDACSLRDRVQRPPLPVRG